MEVKSLDLTARTALVLGYSAGAAEAWQNATDVARLAGGGVGGGRAATDALDRLQEAGLVETRRYGTRTYFRRTEAGLAAAEAALLEDHDGLLREAAERPAHGEWEPSPGDPGSIDELVGQDAARYRVATNLEWAERTQRRPQPMLFSGPAGVGKTLIAKLVSRRLAMPLLHVSLADLTPRELNEVLQMAEDGAVLFLDELQAGSAALRERLLVALDPDEEHAFVAIGATTDPGRLSAALRRRFPLEVAFEEYTPDQAVELTRQRARGMGLVLEGEAAELIARASRCNPARITALLTEAAMLVEGTGSPVTVAGLDEHLDNSGMDRSGLDTVDLQILVALRDDMGGRPAGLAKLATTIGRDRSDVEHRVAALRRDRLIESRGTPGHAITFDGRKRLADCRL